jgi:hypothetical protein
LSPFVSTAGDYKITAKSDDKVMQSIFRSDENLESTDEFDALKGRAEGKERALHLVMYEIPNALLMTPEEVEHMHGLGSSKDEGLIAMREIKERLFFGDDISEYAVAIIHNPF